MIATDGNMEDTKQPSGVMVNAEGEWVVAEPDQASWDQYQAKAKVSAAAQQAAALGDKDLQEKGLECPIDKRQFVEPTKTPCCNTTYCNECIINALLESGLTCPSCSTEDIVLDHLTADEETAAKIRTHQEEKVSQDSVKDAPRCPALKTGHDHEKSSTLGRDSSSKDVSTTQHQRTSLSPKSEQSIPDKLATKAATTLPGPAPTNGKKRPAETDLKNDRTPLGPSAAAPTRQSTVNRTNSHSTQKWLEAPSNSQLHQLPFNNGSYMMSQGSNTMMFPNMDGMNGFPALPTNPGMYDPRMMGINTFMGQDANWNMWGPAYAQQQTSMTGPGYPSGMYATAGYNPRNTRVPMSNGSAGMNGMGSKGYSAGSFPNQQRNHFQGLNDEESAYFRKPVNPHRHQARRNTNRPTDYREI